jgi:hypothetical protein
MECSTKTKILRVLNLVVILSLCFWVKYKNDKAKEMIQWNTKIINSIGVVSFTQSLNADVLMDIIAELDKDDYGSAGGVFASFEDPKPVPQKGPMPEGMEESYVQQPFSKFKADKDGNEVVAATFNQVIEDLQRIDTSVRAFASNNLFQKQSLDLIYKRLTEGDIKLQKVEEEGQEIYYIIQEDRYEDEPVKDVKEEELENFEWYYVSHHGANDEG